MSVYRGTQWDDTALGELTFLTVPNSGLMRNSSPELWKALWGGQSPQRRDSLNTGSVSPEIAHAKDPFKDCEVRLQGGTSLNAQLEVGASRIVDPAGDLVACGARRTA